MKNDQHQYEVSVVIPCFNEELNIPEVANKVLESFDENLIKGEIVLVNDGSSDGSAPVIQAMSSRYKNVIGIHHHHNLGITEAWNSGIMRANGRYVVTIDADMQYDPGDIGKLYRIMKEGGCDIVQGWRKEYKDASLMRKFISRSLSCMLNVLFFTRMHDIKSGFVIAKKEVLFDILKERHKLRLYQHFFILCALKKGYCLKQAPVGFYQRNKGKSFIVNPALFSLKVLLELPRAIIEYGIVSRLFNKEKDSCVGSPV